MLTVELIRRAIVDYRIGMIRGYIENGRITKRLKDAIRKQRKACGFDEDGCSQPRMEGHCRAEDFESAVIFLRRPGVLELYVESAGLEIDPDVLRQSLNRQEQIRSSMRYEDLLETEGW